MSIKSIIIGSAIAGLSFINSAFAAPQTGTWLIANGQNAYGGDIINIDAQGQNLFVIFAVGEVPNNTYFLYGRGTIAGDNVDMELTSSKDLSTRRVTGSFNTSTTGVLNFPGVGARSVYRVKLEDESNPQSMMGAWIFNYQGVTSGIGVSQIRYFNSFAPGSVNGSGIAIDASGKFACEYQVKGDLQGYYLCVDFTVTTSLKVFSLKRSANEAAGLYVREDSSTRYIGNAQRMSTSNESIILVKEGSDNHRIITSAINNFVANYGASMKTLMMEQR
ncbi:MAG: hypothetical protein I8H77_10520 [Comamonadaceae bacterium]|nr:hypothetical protein [Comamonadaceae bacterium]